MLLGITAVVIFATYARLPPHETYHVSRSGLVGGASRALVFLNFPVALAAIPILVLLAERVGSRGLTAVAVLGVAFCAAVFWPGVVNEADLDARPVNGVAGLGVALAVAGSVGAWRLTGLERPSWRAPGDRGRVAIAAAAVVLAVPWIAADVGVSLNGVPVLGGLFQTGELRQQPGDPMFHPAVHHGHHHGMDGVLLIITTLLLSRLLPKVQHRAVGSFLTAYLALAFCYGVGNVANDFWLEQVVKRGWTQWEIPNVTEPRLTIAWGIIVAGAVALWAVSEWHARRARMRPLPA